LIAHTGWEILIRNFYGGEPIWNTAERQGVRTAFVLLGR